jgi:hypothetical protein
VPSSVSRRNILRLALAGAGIAATGPALARTGLLDGGGVVQQGVVNGVLSEDAPFAGPSMAKFERDLVVPQVLAPTSTTAATSTSRATRVYDLEHRVSTQQILPAPYPATEIWSYNGTVPGPTIRQTRNGPLTVVRNKNSLPAGHPYSMHLHGSPSQPFYDGHPDDLTPVGATKTYRYPNSQEARTLWYHDHAIHQTAEHVYKGLAGLLPAGPVGRGHRQVRAGCVAVGQVRRAAHGRGHAVPHRRHGRLRRQGSRQPLGQRERRERPGMAQDARRPHPLPLPHAGRVGVAQLQLRALERRADHHDRYRRRTASLRRCR